MKNLTILLVLVLLVTITGSTSYVFADVFSTLEVTGTSTFFGDLIFDRTAFDNSIVQGQAAFDASKPLVYQKIGGGDMSGYKVRANEITLTGGVVGIGTETPNPFVALEVNGVATFNNDLIFDRTDFDNSIVQGTNAFNVGKHLIYQKQGGGDMSGYIVRADQIILTGGVVAIGTETPDFSVALDVNGDMKINGNILSSGDICIGSCT